MSTEATETTEATTQDLYRFWFQISSEKQWYNIIRECRGWFGKNWKGQNKVRRKITHSINRLGQASLPVWFDVPDSRFATWVSVKYSIQVQSDAKYKSGK